MTPQLQRIVIAHACGKDNLVYFGEGLFCEAGSDGLPDLDTIWDPLSDLNVMHEVEKTLTLHQKLDYSTTLAAFTDGPFDSHGPHWYRVAHATAAQRAEAFLRTIGKWTTD